MSIFVTEDSMIEIIRMIENDPLTPWREALACAYSGANLYIDDGELQDSSKYPFIDYRRDSIEEIRSKIKQRGRQRFEDSLRSSSANVCPRCDCVLTEKGMSNELLGKK